MLNPQWFQSFSALRQPNQIIGGLYPSYSHFRLTRYIYVYIYIIPSLHILPEWILCVIKVISSLYTHFLLTKSPSFQISSHYIHPHSMPMFVGWLRVSNGKIMWSQSFHTSSYPFRDSILGESPALDLKSGFTVPVGYGCFYAHYFPCLLLTYPSKMVELSCIQIPIALD